MKYASLHYMFLTYFRILCYMTAAGEITLTPGLNEAERKKAKEHYVDFLKRGTPEHIHEFFSDDEINDMWKSTRDTGKAKHGSPPNLDYIIV